MTIIVACAVCTMLVLPSMVRPLRADESSDFVERLRKRDAQFDNMQLKYARSATYSKLRPQHRSYLEEIIVRGTDITLISEAAFHGSGRKSYDYSKRGFIGGICKNLHLVTKSGPDGVLRYHREDGGLYRLQLAAETMLGFGFGKRLIEVKSVKPTDVGHTISATVELWHETTWEGTFDVDANLITRMARLRRSFEELDVSEELDISMTGTVERDGLWFAKTGHMVRTSRGRVVGEHQISFRDLTINLSDERYELLTHMEVPKGVDIIDPDGIAKTE